MRRSLAYLPLHGGKTPRWLFERMTDLAGAITMAVVEEYGPEEMLRRLADPWWFQAFGCVLGFDWHSSGVTTVTCGALKEARRRLGREMGILAVGGKGGTSRKTPVEIAQAAERHAISAGDKLIYASRMSAKVDSAAVQDGYELYHHSFFFTESGSWCVVQQGMNDAQGTARRYHWLGESVDDFVCEPHNAIEDLADQRVSMNPTEQFLPLNMVAAEAAASRSATAELIRHDPARLLKIIEEHTSGPTLFAPRHHPVLPENVNYTRLKKIVRIAHEQHPQDFAALLGTAEVGAATVRSLALIAELIYDAPVCRRDPTEAPESESSATGRQWPDYSFAHGGKDGFPFPVTRQVYDRNIAVLSDAVQKAKTGLTEKKEALKRLARICG